MSGSPFPGGYDNAVLAIRGHVDQLGVSLATWSARDDARPCPEARRAANTAIDAIDAMLRDLYAIRARLISEVRISDDATAARVDALLAGRARDQELSEAIRPENTEGRALGTPGPAKGNADENPH